MVTRDEVYRADKVANAANVNPVLELVDVRYNHLLVDLFYTKVCVKWWWSALQKW